MADFSRPLHRNHSAILSKKLSNVHSFAEKSIYDDVFATPSKRRTRTFSSRVEDYSEIFNSSNSSRPSSIPVLDLPVVDKQNVCVNIQNSKFEYSEIFGGFNNIDISMPEEFIKSKDGDTSSGEVWSSSETGSPSGASDISNSRKKNHVRPHDANHQSIDGKKQFNMSYNKTNVGSQDWTNGTTHIAQLHAVPGFTCIIDENTPLPKTEGNKSVPSVNDVSPNRGVGKGILDGKHFRKASAHLPDRGVNGHTFEGGDVKFGHSRSYSSDLLFNAYEIGQKERHAEVMRPSGPEPNLGNINSHSERVSASKSEEFRHEDLESTRSDFSITFSDEELDTNSDAAVSAAAVRKAIEMAQASIRIAKESMERKKGLQSSLKQNFKDGLKFKERKKIKIADEGNRLKEKKTQEPCETEKTLMQNISETDKKNARTGEASPTFEDSKNYFPDEGAAGGTNGKGSESVPVVEHKQERQRESETTQQSYDFLNIGKYRETTLVSKEDNKKEMMQFIDEYDWKRWKTTDTIELPDSDGKNLKVVEEAFELEQIGRKLDADKEGAQEGENHGNKLESAQDIHGHEENEKNLRVAPKQEETEEMLKASQEQKQSEKTLIESQKTVENEKELETQEWEMDDFKKGLKEFQFETEINLKQTHEGEENEKISEADGGFEENVEIYEEKYERGLKICEEDETNFKEAEIGLEKVQEQELRLDDYHGGKASDKKLEEDIEGEGIEKLDEAENDKLLKEEKNGFLTCEEENHQGSYDACKQDKREKLSSVEETSSKEIDDDVEATQEELACEGSSRVIEATEAYSEPEENESACESVYNDKLDQDNESAYNEVFRQTSWDQDALDADDDELENSMDDESDALLNDDDDDAVHEAEKNENDLNMVSAAYIMEEKEMFLAKDALEEQNDIENIIDDKEPILVDDLGLSSGDEKNQVDQNENEFGFAHSLDEQVEKRTHELEITSDAMKEAEVVFDQVEEISQFQVAHGDKQWLENEQEMEGCELNSDREAEETVQENVALEKKHLRNLDEAKEKENERERERVRVRERERERQAVDRAIREARERAFAEAREKAEKAALERATAEARQRVKTDFRERVDKASAGANLRAEKSSMEAKLRAERAAVERATEEARERALEKALSEKAAFKTREQTKSRSFSSTDPPQGSGPSSSFRHSNSSNYGVTFATERSDDGANTESAQRCKARLEKDQRIVERAAKALEEKNKRDLLAQKEQAERNRFAEALDADVKRWSSGKAGNLRALLSTLQYVLGPGSGWQPIPLTEIVTNSAVKKAYRKATLFVHPDKLQQRGASIQQKYICEKVFDLLKEAWNRFNSEER